MRNLARRSAREVSSAAASTRGWRNRLMPLYRPEAGVRSGLTADRVAQRLVAVVRFIGRVPDAPLGRHEYGVARYGVPGAVARHSGLRVQHAAPIELALLDRSDLESLNCGQCASRGAAGQLAGRLLLPLLRNQPARGLALDLQDIAVGRNDGLHRAVEVRGLAGPAAGCTLPEQPVRHVQPPQSTPRVCGNMKAMALRRALRSTQAAPSSGGWAVRAVAACALQRSRALPSCWRLMGLARKSSMPESRVF